MHQMKKPLVVLFTLALAACSANGSDPKGVTTANISANVFQLSVGTANLYGTMTGLNVVTTYRQPINGGLQPGDSGTLLNSPKLTVPGQLPATAGSAVPYDPTSTILTGPAPAEADGHTLNSTSQVPNSTNQSTFGLSGGAFGLGLEPYDAFGPYDAGSGGQIGTPFQVAPYPVPLYDPAGDTNAFTAWGGPPAFDVAGNGQSVKGSGAYPAGTDGAEMGIDVFATIPPAIGAYQLTLAIPANTGYVTQTASALLNSNTPLPTVQPPAVGGYGTGGATLVAAIPAAVSEAYLEVVDIGPVTPTSATSQPASCNGSGAGSPTYYTIKITASGSYPLGVARGPGGAPSICTAADNTTTNGAATSGDQFVVHTVGFDYPLFEASYPNSSGNPKPNIVGNNGSDDVTISVGSVCVEPASAAGPFGCTPNLPVTGSSKGRHSKAVHTNGIMSTRRSTVTI
jgi:hypothetical protein